MNDVSNAHESNIPPNPSVVWGDIAPSEHIAHFYESESVLLQLLTRYVGSGLLAGESAIVIANRAHLRALDERLNASGVYVAERRHNEHYITVDAEEALEKFIVNKRPDEEKFYGLVLGLIERASAGGRRVRAFGEMVALLWARGDIAATIRLECPWNKVCKAQTLPLFCAYPKAGFTEENSTAIAEICASHSRIV